MINTGDDSASVGVVVEMSPADRVVTYARREIRLPGTTNFATNRRAFIASRFIEFRRYRYRGRGTKFLERRRVVLVPAVADVRFDHIGNETVVRIVQLDDWGGGTGTCMGIQRGNSVRGEVIFSSRIFVCLNRVFFYR